MSPEIFPRICQYLGGIVSTHDGTPLAINGAREHVHIAAIIRPTIAISKFVGAVKASSSRWIHDTFDALSRFSWQEGYSAFTVSRSAKDDVVTYIARQEAHHKRMSFQEELIALLEKHEVEYDKRYVWK